MLIKELYQNFYTESKEILSEISARRPLILQITNEVTINDCANITLNWGALPVMSGGSVEDAQEMLNSAAALLINTGILNDKNLEIMLKSAERANELNIPVVLDPVGVGATDFRLMTVKKLLKKVDFAVIKGNQSEIDVLGGGKAEMLGVESLSSGDSYKKSALKLAAEQNAIIVATGAEDFIADQKNNISFARGDKMMSEVVGTGCMLGSTLAVFSSLMDNDRTENFKKIVSAVLLYNLCAEKAAEAAAPAYFKIKFMDGIYRLQKNKDLLNSFEIYN
ncbi:MULTISPECIES: hydroxyethylthiazole kinase [unclassified Halanaerobium]|uniref:hydroxyethylthiazole kinase n=1 Tax=unclassified Halanaerobium TaxID=2641197 RepID=UPI000DF2575A|nr:MULTISPECIES: hydroxyethylthiazole kinase [unclassified Halanaerobium]RCW50758.1 hydroxyethylthiazole kinase [Halanaerobium sp. MA284_MarDTE_T2]RCW78004.1 hydroxyethylthiazole kinase [Halanaerobium sp. DL-01]